MDSRDVNACASVRSGNLNIVPGNSDRTSHPNAANGVHWSGCLSASPALETKSTRLPGFAAVTFGRKAQDGSKNTTCRPLTNEGMSVRW